MIASVLIEHNVKSLDKTFDYVVPENLSKDISVGHKVLVPFGSQIVEGFVLNLSNKYDPSMEYKEVINIAKKYFGMTTENANKIGFLFITPTIYCPKMFLPLLFSAKNEFIARLGRSLSFLKVSLVSGIGNPCGFFCLKNSPESALKSKSSGTPRALFWWSPKRKLLSCLYCLRSFL